MVLEKNSNKEKSENARKRLCFVISGYTSQYGDPNEHDLKCIFVRAARNAYRCEKDPTGDLNRGSLITHINLQALQTPDM